MAALPDHGSQIVGAGRLDERVRHHPSAGPHGEVDGIDGDVLHGGDVDDEAVLAAAPSHETVATAPYRQRQVVLPGELHTPRDIVRP